MPVERSDLDAAERRLRAAQLDLEDARGKLLALSQEQANAVNSYPTDQGLPGARNWTEEFAAANREIARRELVVADAQDDYSRLWLMFEKGE